MKKSALWVFVPSLFLSSCAQNPFLMFYQPNQYVAATDVAARRLNPAPNDPIVYSSTDIRKDAQTALQHGYTIIGISSFNSPNVSYEMAKDQARRVGADAVLVYSKYTNTVTGVMPWTVPTTQTSTTNMNGTAYGSGGSVTMNGTAMTTTYGSQTTYIPYSVNRSDYYAMYLVKTRMRFGAFFTEMNDQQRQELQSNSGIVITVVVDDSPAFNADILPGDIITQVNANRVGSIMEFSSLLTTLAGQQVTLTIWRNGKSINKIVTMNQ